MKNNFSICRKIFLIFGVILLIFVISEGSKVTTNINELSQQAAFAGLKTKHQPIVEKLIKILKAKPAIKEALKTSIQKAAMPDVPNLKAFYKYLDKLVTLIPTERDLFPKFKEFYYLIDQSPGKILQKDSMFQQWTHQFAIDWGKFLDSTESAKYLKTFIDDPAYKMDDYMVAPSGWLTFNQFFARHVKPGKRPIDGLNDDSIIVSAAGSVFHGQWKIDEKSQITAKGMKWSVADLLDGSPYKDRFKGGTYIHMFLNVTDYHRFHVPVRGKILESRKISGKVILDVIKKEDGSFDAVDGDTFQFTQERGLIIIDSPVGLVAVLPIGMAQVSSVHQTAEKGVTLHKGEEFGYFSFGGSDIVLMFEPNKVKITAKVGTHYNQGKKIAEAIK